jgi:hypothetical protein
MAAAPQTRLTSITPIFAVTDLGHAMNHYQTLGFEVTEHESGGYGFAKRDGIVIHLTPQVDFDPSLHASAAYLYVEDADALAHEWRQPEIDGRTLAPVETPYGLLEGAHIDPDHNIIRFGSPTPKRDEVLRVRSGE